MFNEIKGIKSKVIGRRNWVIKTIDNTAYLMSWGWANRHHALINTLDHIAEHNIRWLTFTYKADAFEALEKLEKIGYKTETRA